MSDFDWKKTLSTVAPALAAAFGGPLAGTGVKLLGDALLGNPDTTKEEIQKLIEGGMSPEQLQAAKNAENVFKQSMRDLDIKEAGLYLGDVANARDRQIKTGDSTNAWLAFGVSAGFFTVLLYLLINGKPTEGGDALMIMLGSLGTAWTGIISYYFGSSLGSKNKQAELNAINDKKKI